MSAASENSFIYTLIYSHIKMLLKFNFIFAFYMGFILKSYLRIYSS